MTQKLRRLKKALILLFTTFFINSVKQAYAQRLVTINAKKVARETPRMPSKIVYFGDSFTSAPTSYANLIFAENAIPKTNRAIGGTSVCSSDYDTTTGGSNLIDLYQNELSLGYTGQLVSFAYGHNDRVYITINAQWKATYKAIIQSFIDAGFPRRRLLIMANPSHSTQAASRVQLRLYILEIAAELGILYYDVYGEFIATGTNDSFFSAGDGYVHPTEDGQQVIATGYLNYLNR